MSQSLFGGGLGTQMSLRVGQRSIRECGSLVLSLVRSQLLSGERPMRSRLGLTGQPLLSDSREIR